MRGKKEFVPRVIDRAMFGILAVLHGVTALYVLGPWYIDTHDTIETPLIDAFDNHLFLTAYGVLLLLDGLALAYITLKSKIAHYTAILSNVLMAGFLLRLFALIGVIASLETWRPPTYLSHAATIFIVGAYWIYVQTERDERPT